MNTSFFPREQNYFAKNQLIGYSSEKKHCPPPNISDIYLSRISYFKQAYQKN